MSTIDPGKLKVVELRAELTSRGLDSKGNKAVLVERLKEALEKELETELLSTSIVDTSTEEINSSQENEGNTDGIDNIKDVKDVEDVKVTTSPKKAIEKSPTKVHTENVPKAELVMNETKENESSSEHKMEMKAEAEESTEPEPEAMEEDDKPIEELPKPVNDVAEDKPTEEQPKGEKRRRTGDSPQRVQRIRTRSPLPVIKEDEPEIDPTKILLSWYDSDLNLRIDKQTFLSAKPIVDGAFGYSWAGARTTHGVKRGKAYYEIKITEEIKWEDIIKQIDRRRDHRADRRDRHRIDRRGRGADTSKQENKSEKKAVEEKEEENKETATEGNSIENKVDGNAAEDSSKENAIDKNNADEILEKEADTIADGESEKPKDPDTKENGNIKLEENSVQSDAKDEKLETKTEPMEVDTPPSVPIPTHAFRCGWSVSGTFLQLGETQYSYGFGSNGKFANNNELIDYGTSFTVGDAIGCYIFIDDAKIELTYTINGVSQGLALSIPCSELPEDFTIFPHVLSRNYAFELNLGTGEPWFASPAELSDYIYIEAVEDKVQGPTRPALRSECEVVMMCGLPSSGKSHWVQEILKENPDKAYTIIGTKNLLERMTLNGKPLKETYKHRWNIMLDRLMKCTNTLVDKAATRRRNIIIDQTNVFPSAQRRKMRLFEGFKRRAVIIVLNDEEQAKRTAQQEAQEGKDVPESTLLEMKANMTLPKPGDWLEEVKYVELGEEEAQAIVQKYNAEGKAAGFERYSSRPFRDNRGPNRWNRNNSRKDYRDNYRDRPYQNNRFRPSFPDRRPGPANWNRDRRDTRGPPRDDRNSRPGPYDRSVHRDRNWSGNFRNSRPQGGRSQNSNWPNTWQGGQGWEGQGGYNNWGQGSWSGQNQWKGSYSQGAQGGYNQGGYGNWNYYGQYANNWSGNK